MYEQTIESIRSEAGRLATTQRSSVNALQNLVDEDGNSISLASAIGDDDRTVSDLDTLSSTVVKFAEGFREDKNWAFAPRKWIEGFRDALKNTANSYENLGNNLASIEDQHGGLATIDSATLALTTKSGTQIDAKKILVNISTNLDEAFAAYFQLRPAISAPRLTEFSDLFSLFSSRRSELDTLARELARLKERSEDATKSIERDYDSVKVISQELATLKETSSTQQNKIESALTEAASKLTGIQEVHENSEELRSSVTEYRSDFNKFQSELDSRNADYEEKLRDFVILKEVLDHEGRRIKEITAQADDMLKGATNAGLAGSYSNKQIGVESEIRKARLAYYVSIGLLVFLTLPIFIYSFPKEYVAEFFKHVFGLDLPPLLGRDTAQPEFQQFLNFIGRAIFLIPGLMLVRFASSRHERLFRLREDYAYKYSIASSVDGFMKQSKTYADDIAAASYYELTYNPADRMDERAEDSRMMNPLFEKMLGRLESRLIKNKQAKKTETGDAPQA